MKSSQTYHLEIVVGEDEAPENALKRFRWATKSSGLVNEARRRRYFENKQDEIKRRVRDGHMKKSKRYVPPPTYEDAVTTMEPAPFADLFGDSEDIFGQQGGGEDAPQTRSAF
ncbi:g9834 [Coccomyxa viridis]|uniref:G9834 protein n=1 Tax=Coccomyxa viridis TaxID=1274662 RepID=A0ABP1G6K9_9CHLO